MLNRRNGASEHILARRLARMRQRQLELAQSGRIRESARYARMAEQLRRASCDERRSEAAGSCWG